MDSIGTGGWFYSIPVPDAVLSLRIILWNREFMITRKYR